MVAARATVPLASQTKMDELDEANGAAQYVPQLKGVVSINAGSEGMFPKRRTFQSGCGILVGQRHFDARHGRYKHDAPASVFSRQSSTRWRFLVSSSKVAMSH